MRVSVTASQAGITPKQYRDIEAYLLEHRPTVLTHGGCIGGDDTIDLLAAQLGIYRFVFPSTITAKRIPDEVLRSRGKVFIFAPMPPLERNPKIVLAGDILLACPRQSEVLRSGTWATVRQARKRHLPYKIFFPS